MAYPRRGYCKSIAARTQNNQATYAAGWIYFPAGVQGVVYKSTDFGATWESLPGTLPDTIFDVMADYEAGPRILCATTGGLYRSTDEGRTWYRVIAQRGLRAVAGSGGHYAAAGDSGVWFSTDRGSTWAKCDTGLAVTRVTCLEFISGSDGWLWLLAGTYGGAVYYWDFGPTAIAGPSSATGLRLTSNIICRNRLHVNLRHAGMVRLVDATGRVVLSAGLPAGESELDLSRISAGIYQLVKPVSRMPVTRVVVGR